MRNMLTMLLILLLFAVFIPTYAQNDNNDITADFTYYDDNPVLQRGAEGEWDAGFVAPARVVYAGELFHMFYTGADEDFRTGRQSIGYATSEDGINWAKHPDNPVLELDESAFRLGVASMAVLHEDDGWLMYITPRSTEGIISLGTTLLRATADDPAGPWAIDEEPQLTIEGRTWDNPYNPDTILHTEDGYVLYYTGCRGELIDNMGACAIGRTTSEDGIEWTRYDDPETTVSGLDQSDPVFTASRDWELWVYSAAVMVQDGQWEMFFEGGSGATSVGIGYATSENGINWERYDGQILAEVDDFTNPSAPSVVVVDDTYYIYFTIWELNAYNYEIGLATGTISRE